MKTSLLASFCLMLTAVWALFFTQAKSHYGRPDYYISKINVLNKKVEKEKLKHLFTQYEFEGFRQHVATLMPGVIQQKGKGEKAYPFRALASVVQKSHLEKLDYLTADELFEKSKNSFREKRYPVAVEGFEKLIGEHSYSVHVPEALFLLMESNYQMREFSKALAAYEKLLEIYPSSELTGYAMIRVGKIYETENRFDDAISMYRNALVSFPQREIAALAREHLKASGQ